MHQSLPKNNCCRKKAPIFSFCKGMIIMFLLLMHNMSIMSNPIISTPATININESSVSKFVVTIAATGNGAITYDFSTGSDTSGFIINGISGDLSFRFYPDYENPRGRNITATSVAVGNTYRITVRATDIDGSTTINLTINVLNVNENPDPPRNLFLISQNESNILQWTESVVTTGITEYRIYSSEDSVSWNYRGSVPAGTTTYTDNSLVNGRFYFYTVRAWNGTSESVNSNIDASTPSDAEISRYMHFDGDNDYMVVSDSSKLMSCPFLLGTTMGCWVRFNTLPSGKVYILSRDYNLPNVATPPNGSPFVNWYSIYYDPDGGGADVGKLVFEYNVNGSSSWQRKITSTFSPAVNTWYHVAGTYTYSSSPVWYPVSFYIDGHLQDFAVGTNANTYESLPGTQMLAESRFVIGATTTGTSPFTYGNFFDGDIAEVRYMTTSLDSTAIQSSMYTRLRGDEANLIGLWHLDAIYNNQVYNYDNLNFNALIQGDVCVASPLVVAVKDTVSVLASTLSYIDVKKNDTASGPRQTVLTRILTGPVHGSATVVNYDSISYDPGCFVGTDTIKYLICDTTFFHNPYKYSDTAIVVITVNDNPPVITSNGGGANAVVSMSENITDVTTVTATDIDVCHSRTYSLSGGADQSLFTINTTTGELTFISAPNFEAPADAGSNNVYDVRVAVFDGTLTDTQDIAITIVDANEAPEITSDGGGATASVTVNENITTVTIVTATDVDASTTLTYGITGGADQALFSIDGSTGVLNFSSAPDYEIPGDAGSNNVYDVQVTVTDNGTGSLTDVQDITITVIDANDNPVITSNGGGATAAISINENTTAVTTVAATDEDSPSQTLTYSISGGADAAVFNIVPATGVLTFASAPDFEIPSDAGLNNVYDVQVTVTDNGTGSLTDVQDIAVTVVSVNEAPVFTSNGGSATASVSMNENTTAVTTVTATDEDASTTLTYTISGGADQMLFNINSTTGDLAFVNAPDFEAPADAGGDNVYDVTVTVSDGALTDVQDIAVTIVDVVEVANFTLDIKNENVNENTAYTSTAPVLSGDSPIGNLTFSISGGTDAGLFTINATTGVISMVGRDYESPADANADNVYELEITATDDDGNSDSENWTVTVTDVIEIASFTIDAINDVNINENTPYTSVTPNITGSPIGAVTYTISGGEDATSFTINSTTGVVSMVPRDYENPVDDDADNTYELTITATDDDGNTDSESWAVTVNNATEAVSFTIDAINDVNINENTPYTSVTPNITGSPIGTVTYTISGGEDATSFTINSTTGVVSMVPRDYENPVDDDADNNYELTITATDADGNADSESWAVTVNNAIETASFTIDAIEDVDINENTPYTSVTPSITGTPIGSVTFTISGIDAADFTIDALTGVVSMVARDYGNPVDDNADNVYELIITATDDDGNSDSESWTVTINNINNAPTAINLSNYEIEENLPIGTLVGTLTSTDPDAGDTHTYALLPGNDGLSFILDGNAIESNVSFDYEQKSAYNLTIRSTDNNGGSFERTISINIINVNEAPIILDEYNISADTIYGEAYTDELTQICLNATDPDNNLVTISSIIPQNGDASPEENNNPCLNYQSFPDFIGTDILTIEVCDNGTPSLCDNVIMILDVAPRFIIPQAISPNNDGVNDRWIVGGIDNYPNNTVTIFNRWGNVVYKVNGYDNSNVIWNGSLSGSGNEGFGELPEGTYFYIIQLNETYKLSGFVVLKR